MLILDLVRRTAPWPPAATFVARRRARRAGVLATAVAMSRLPLSLAARGGRRRWHRRLPRNAKALRRYTDPTRPRRRRGRPGARPRTRRGQWPGRSARAGRTWPPSSPAPGPARPPPRWPRPSWPPPGRSTPVRTSATWWISRPRSRGKNAAVWIFDPQGIADGQPTWWWNPLDMATDLAGARNLAGLFAAASRPPGAQRDAYFDPEGEELLAILLLAARLSDQPLTTVYQWLSTGRNDRVVVEGWRAGATNWPPRPCSTS